MAIVNEVEEQESVESILFDFHSMVSLMFDLEEQLSSTVTKESIPFYFHDLVKLFPRIQLVDQDYWLELIHCRGNIFFLNARCLFSSVMTVE